MTWLASAAWLPAASECWPTSTTSQCWHQQVFAAEVFPTAQRVLGAFGLDLSPAKTQAWSKAAACPAGLEPYWREFGLTLVGVPLGDPLPDRGLPDDSDGRRVDLGTNHDAQERCEEVAARAAAFLDKLGDLPTEASPHLPAVQAAALLLRLCGAGKLTHLLRTTLPTLASSAARSFDAALLETYEKLAALDPRTGARRHSAACRCAWAAVA